MRLYHRYLLTILAILIPTLALVSIALMVQFDRSAQDLSAKSVATLHTALSQQFHQFADELVQVIANELINPMALHDSRAVRAVVESVRIDPGIDHIYVYDREGRIVTAGADNLNLVGRPLAEVLDWPLRLGQSAILKGDRRLQVAEPIKIGDQLLGGVVVGLSLERIQEHTDRLSAELERIHAAGARSNINAILITAGLALFVAGLTTGLVARSLSRPIELLSATTTAIGRGNYNVRAPERDRSELGELGHALNVMAHNLKQRTADAERANAAVKQSDENRS